ncbi:MAG: site-2 protease family protein [Candidatus Binataceae bacterium]
MDDFTARKDVSPVLTEIPRYEAPMGPAPVYEPYLRPIRVPPLNTALFLLTLLTTTMAGAGMAGATVSLSVPRTLPNLIAGLSFSIPLMAILLAHEMGHYLTSRRWGVDATLPYFIPFFPTLGPLWSIGTLGAFIKMKSPARTRRAMFDIGAAGPWAGMVVSVIAVIWGLHYSTVTPLDNSQGGLQLGNSILFWSVSRAVLGVDPNTVNVNLSPVALAGWLGFFLTAINLLPVGQLDGGHVIYSAFGSRGHRLISRLAWLGCALMVAIPYFLGLDFWGGWLLWFVLLILLGLGHPATVDADTPLPASRKAAAWATIVLFVVTFSQVPFSWQQPSENPNQQPNEPPIRSVMLHMPAHPSAAALHALGVKLTVKI